MSIKKYIHNTCLKNLEKTKKIQQNMCWTYSIKNIQSNGKRS